MPVTRTVAVVTPEPPSKIGPVAPISSQFVDSTENNPLRKIAFYSGLGLLFVFLGALAEVLFYIMGISNYLLYLFAPPAILGVVATGGVRRTLRSRAGYFYLAFFLCLIPATFFSSWQGGSIYRLRDVARIDLPLLFIVAGLAVNWKEVRLIFYAIAGAGIINLLTARLFMLSENGRFSMVAVGTIGNSNDLASHLLLVLPFLLFVTRDRKMNPLIRLIMFAMIGYGLWVILGTASRGAMLGVVGAIVFFLARSNMRQRTGLILATLIVAGIGLVALPSMTLNRLGSMVGEKGAAAEEADESANARSYVFKQSVIFTLQRPLFGVGPDQFGNFEGKTRVAAGLYGSWHATHNSWTQVSSECGIPALIFFVGGVVGAFTLVNRTYKAAKARGDADIENACFCYMLAMSGFLVSVTFLANAYRIYFPIMIGLGIALSFAAKRQMAERRAAGITRVPRPA